VRNYPGYGNLEGLIKPVDIIKEHKIGDKIGKQKYPPVR
jgi:hypothetical protein